MYGESSLVLFSRSTEREREREERRKRETERELLPRLDADCAGVVCCDQLEFPGYELMCA